VKDFSWRDRPSHSNSAPRRRDKRRGTYLARAGQLTLAFLIVAACVWMLGRGAETVASTFFPTPTPTPPPTPTPIPPRVGLIAGHNQFPPAPEPDPGAMCDDGLREADITLDLAHRVQAILVPRGYAVDLLGEFDARLAGYRALALVAIHADTCKPGLSGFKVASLPREVSALPETDAHLTNCLWNEYAAATGLPRHPFTITADMLYYHAFYQVAQLTPAAIIEVGFMHADRPILVQQPERAARGIAQGIICFVEGNKKP